MHQDQLKEELCLIVDTVERFPEGLSLSDLIGGLSSRFSRRTLQRRLLVLIQQSRLTSTGHARSVRYHLPTVERDVQIATPILVLDDEGKLYVPTSVEGQAIKQQARLPLTQRKAVSYNQDFLERYIPNKSHYLTQSIRDHLHTIGGANDGHRPGGTYARELLSRLLIDLSWNSSRLEGNTYSLLETERLINDGLTADTKSALEAQMILNHKACIEYLVENAEETQFDTYTIRNIHALLSDNLLGNSNACGQLRKIAVSIGGSSYTPPVFPQAIEESFGKILAKGKAISDPFEQAFFAMVHLPYLQAFEDVNKRTSRLAMNIPLIKNNLCPLSFIGIPEYCYIDGIIGVYELNRVELLCDVFVWAYECSVAQYGTVRRIIGGPDPFRLQYRSLLSEKVRFILQEKMDKQTATNYIQQWARENIPSNDQLRFVEMVERELQGLHQGNIVRYQIRLSEFDTWKAGWN